jgi:hypothetical protein
VPFERLRISFHREVEIVFRIEVDQFQALAGPIALDVSGLTILMGPSNSGKTAFVRALLAWAENRKGTEFVAPGAASARVTVIGPRGRATWTKGVGVGDYAIDGEVHRGTGRTTPEALARLGFRPLRIQDRSVWVQVRRQFDLPFLVGESPPTAAAILMAGRRPGVYREAVRLARDEVAELERAAATTTRLAAAVAASEERLLPWAERLRTREADATATRSRLATALARRDRVAAVRATRARLVARVAVGGVLERERPRSSVGLRRERVREVRNSLLRRRRELAQAEEMRREIGLERAAVERELAELLRERGVCPLCGSFTVTVSCNAL